MVFFLLWHGWSAAQISTEFEITDLDAVLANLESVGLIRKQARTIKIMATPRIDQRGGGQLAELNRELARLFLSEINLQNPQCEWTFYTMRLSRSSVARLRESVSKFVQEVRALTVSDATLPPPRGAVVSPLHRRSTHQPGKDVTQALAASESLTARCRLPNLCIGSSLPLEKFNFVRPKV